LKIIQKTEYKNIELISFEFDCANEDSVRQHVTFRYGSMKSKLALMEGRYQDIREIIRLKNPSLLLHIDK
jgi:hypothetical protein